MASSDLYCPYCECIRSEEPCIDCIESQRQCKGECICCEEYRTNNTKKAFSERKEERVLSGLEDNKELEVKTEHLQNKREFHFLGAPTFVPKPKSESRSSSPNDTHTESLRENGSPKQIEGDSCETRSVSESSSDGYCDYLALEVKGLNTQVNGDFGKEINYESTDFMPFEEWKVSRLQQMASMARWELCDIPGNVVRQEIPRKPNQCDGCACLPGHVSCKECIYWDFTCTYPIGAFRCTCCDDFENLLDEI